MQQDYLDIDEPLLEDLSVNSYSFHEYGPIVGTNLNNVNSEIRIVLENQDIFTHPSKSYLLVKGRLIKNAGTLYAEDDAITFANNGIMHLFSNIKYHLGDKLVDELNYPGHATTIKGLITYGSAEQTSLLGSCWQLDSAASTAAAPASNDGFKSRQALVIKQSDPKGSFSFAIPTSHFMGFFEDYTKIIYGVKQTLTLMRASNDDAIFKAAAVADAGKIEIQHLSWLMPHVVPSDESKLRLYKLIDRGASIDLGFSHWHHDSCELSAVNSFTWRLITTSSIEKPRWIIFALQTDRQNSEVKNSSVFDHCSLTDCHVTLNSERHPFLDLNVDFNKGDYATLYRMFKDYRKSRHDSDDVGVSLLQYKKAYPLVVIDCSKQSERLQSGIVDVQAKFRFGANVPASTRLHALIIADRKMKLKLDRGKVEVAY